MAKWVPPVPAGKLYGRDALALGSGLAMLLWCYDGVERDGSVKVDLMAVASELETPYRTIKDWWRALRNGPFFASVKDRGKLGYVATFNRDWIEWRVMATNYPTLQDSEGQNIALEPPLNEPESPPAPVQGPVKAPSRTDEGRNNAPDLYIGTPVDQRPVVEDVPQAATPPPTTVKSRKPRPVDPNQSHPAVVAFYEKTARRTNKEQAHLIAERVSDLERWQGTMTFWLQRGWSAQNVNGMVSRYERIDDRPEAIEQAKQQQAKSKSKTQYTTFSPEQIKAQEEAFARAAQARSTGAVS